MEPQRKITKTRYKKLQTKLKSLKESLTQLDKDVKYLAEAGKGWRFNNQLGDTMAKYDEINSKIKDLEKFLAESKVVENLDAGGRIVVGSTVKVKYQDGREKEVMIFQEGSSDLDPRSGIISEKSPLATSLLGKQEGVEVELNGRKVKVKKVE